MRPHPSHAAAADSAMLSQMAARLYSKTRLLPRLLQTYRPFICPFEKILPLVPRAGSVLDVGCGAGLFLNLLAGTGHEGQLLGFDSNGAAIEAAKTAAAQSANQRLPQFQRIDATGDWPAGSWDVVSLIDVMHHIPVSAQRAVIERACGALAPGGTLLYKDMVSTPRWLAFANRLHDLVLAQQWIHYVTASQVEGWCRAQGLELIESNRCRMFWYGHEWLVLKKPRSSAFAGDVS